MAAAAVCGLLAASVLLNVFLARKITSLRKSESLRAEEEALGVGSPAPPITGLTVDGTQLTLRFDDVRVPTVLYVFSPQCGWCEKNLDNSRALIAQAGPNYQVVGLAMTRVGLKDYLVRNHLDLRVFANLDPATVAAYRLGGTPTTIVVGPERRVLKVWSGAYQERIRKEIEAYLHVRLHECCRSGQPPLKMEPVGPASIGKG